MSESTSGHSQNNKNEQAPNSTVLHPSPTILYCDLRETFIITVLVPAKTTGFAHTWVEEFASGRATPQPPRKATRTAAGTKHRST